MRTRPAFERMYPQQHPTSRPRLQAHHRLRTWRRAQSTRRPSCWRTPAQVILAHAPASVRLRRSSSVRAWRLSGAAGLLPAPGDFREYHGGKQGAVSCRERRSSQALDHVALCPSMAAVSCAITRADTHCLRNCSAHCHHIPTLAQTCACRGCRNHCRSINKDDKAHLLSNCELEQHHFKYHLLSMCHQEQHDHHHCR